jgi:hypothetical protein
VRRELWRYSGRRNLLAMTEVRARLRSFSSIGSRRGEVVGGCDV